MEQSDFINEEKLILSQLISSFNRNIYIKTNLFEQKLTGLKGKRILACLVYLTLPHDPKERFAVLSAFLKDSMPFTDEALVALHAYVSSDLWIDKNLHTSLLELGASWENCLPRNTEGLTEEIAQEFDDIEKAIFLETAIKDPHTRLYRFLDEAKSKGIITAERYWFLWEILHHIFNKKASVLGKIENDTTAGIRHIIGARTKYFKYRPK